MLIAMTGLSSQNSAIAATSAIANADLNNKSEDRRPVVAGRKVTVRVPGKRISIVAQGVAREGGARGDWVTVENARSGRTFRAQVVGQDEVVVDGGNQK